MNRRIDGFRIGLLVCAGFLVLRLAQLQLIRGSYYRELAEKNRLRVVPESAARGVIVDRAGRVLASNRTVFRVSIVPQEVEDLRGLLAEVGKIAQKNPAFLQKQYEKERSFSFVPAPILSQVSKETVLRLEEERWHLPGLLVESQIIRHYPLGSCAAQLLGYLSQPTPEEFSFLKTYGVPPKELVGRSGIEQLLDEDLRGDSGGLVIEVNHRGRQVRVVGRREPQPGARVVLTIDAQLESLIQDAFGDQQGASVVLNPQTGAVLAMVSNPTFTPESFVTGEAATVRGFLNSPDHPLFNRAVSGAYQPGSIAKLVTGSAGLENGLLTPATTVVCGGGMTIGDRRIHCWNRDGHGSLVLSEALMQSCNVYFMQVARWLGRDRLRLAYEQMGFSRKTGWVLDEQPGHLPRRRLTEGELAMLGIGQGEILITVLQAAIMAGVFANRGWVVHPWVVQAVGWHVLDHPPARRPIGWSPDAINAIRFGMEEVVRQSAGTGHRAFSPNITIAGKTGTAQTHIFGETHGWFVGFCPVDKPKVAFAVLTEHGGSGGELPSEVAKTICEYVSATTTI